jgi:hypothetical protein
MNLNSYQPQASKWDFNFGGQLAINSKNLSFTMNSLGAL